MKHLLGVFVVVLVSACASPYAQFYRGVPDARKLPSYQPLQGEIQIYSTDDFDRDIRTLVRQSYMPIGQSTFNAASRGVTEGQLREQARNVGAQVVLVSSHYVRTASGAAPPTLPQTNGAAHVPGGTVNPHGTGAGTTHGSQRAMMPYAIPRSEAGAVFVIKVFSRVGIVIAPIDDETRKRLKTDGAVSVLEVVEGTPAFAADVLPGDLVLAVGGERVQSAGHYIRLLNRYQGKSVTFEFDRNGTLIEKQLEIRPYTARSS
jgi:S1-C subfamily serine protease